MNGFKEEVELNRFSQGFSVRMGAVGMVLGVLRFGGRQRLGTS